MAERVARELNFCRRRLLGVVGLTIIAIPTAFGQGTWTQRQAALQAENTPAKLPEFEVASIKPDKSGDDAIRIAFKPDGISATNIPLKFLVSLAYGIRKDLISGGPGWINSAQYDIEAKVAGPDVAELGNLSVSQRSSMLQPLLADRFKLKVHTETKVLPVYDLTIAKGSSKLHEAKLGDTHSNGSKGSNGLAHAGSVRIGPGQITAQGVPIANLVNVLSRLLQRTIVDKTGLAGKYDLTLTWTPDEGRGSMPPGPASGQQGADSAPPPDSSGPSIFTALQEQLGLKLESAKGPVETLVIDHVEMPSEN